MNARPPTSRTAIRIPPSTRTRTTAAHGPSPCRLEREYARRAMAIDGANIYWIDNATDGAIMKLAK